MAKKYFKKQKKVKKGANLPPGKDRLKGLGPWVTPHFRMPRYSDDHNADSDNREANRRTASKIRDVMEDPTVFVRNAIMNEKRKAKSSEIFLEE